MENISAKLLENMQLIYRKAIDADDKLAKLQQQGKGKFSHVFAEDSGFNVSSKRFMPYVEDLAKDIAQLEEANEEDLKQNLPDIVKKMELLFLTLSELQNNTKE